jgi:hypothetical protein
MIFLSLLRELAEEISENRKSFWLLDPEIDEQNDKRES